MSNWWQIWVMLSSWEFAGWYYSKGQTLTPTDKNVVQRIARGLAGQTASRVWVHNAGSGETIAEDGWACVQTQSVLSGLPKVEWSD